MKKQILIALLACCLPMACSDNPEYQYPVPGVGAEKAVRYCAAHDGLEWVAAVSWREGRQQHYEITAYCNNGVRVKWHEQTSLR